MNDTKDKLIKLIGVMGLFIGPLYLPILFPHVFAMGEFGLGEILASGSFCFAIIAFSVCVLMGMIRSEKIILFCLSLYILLGAELAGRLIIKSNPVAYEANKAWAKSTYPNGAEFQGHPFLQFSGSNKWYRGFPTKTPKKNKTVSRVVTLGGSTTASGYPNKLQEIFNDKAEVLNFGQAYFTSTHTMINYFLNVIELKPDYLVIHQGWNDNVVRNTDDKTFRSDYAHALKSWELPFIPDLYLIRFSALYRHLKHKLTPYPSWRFIDSNLKIKRQETTENYKDLKELIPFKRNLRAIITSAMANKTKVVLTTQPFVSSGKNFDPGMARHIEQCNQIMRDLVSEFKPHVLFVDLYKLMQKKDDSIFTDFAHVNDSGLAIKAQHIGQAISEDLEAAK
ncbi:MAG: hypothetical protein CME70_22320 [Halobacteriovorax sp.]|nr:hypothetical protein [Halobacteriovorax sp.]|tara:strand:+ start:108112 stop:109293 length:1182 start_codon:yes stop_codon:yes gene_type:complete